MAKLSEPIQVEITATGEFAEILQETRAELEAAREALSEARIRQIVREELEEYEKQLMVRIRSAVGR